MKIRTLIVINFLSLVCFAGNPKDSLIALVNNAGEDTVKVNTMLALSKVCFSSSPDDAIKYAEQAKSLSLKLNFKRGAALAAKNIGIVRYNQGKYIDAINSWQESLARFDSAGDM